MTTDPTAGDGRTPPGEPEPSAQQTSFEEQASPQPQPQQPAGTGFFNSIRRTGLYRADRRWVGGVASGLADRLGWDPLLVRGLFVITFFLGGIGLIAYGIGWALLPEQSDGRIHLEEAVRGNFDVALLGAATMLLVGFAWGGPWDWGFYGSSEWIGGLFWLAVLGGIVYLLVRTARRRPSTRGEPHAQPYPGTQPYGGGQQHPGGQHYGPAQQHPGTQPYGGPPAPGTTPYQPPTGGAPSGPAAHGAVGLDDRADSSGTAPTTAPAPPGGGPQYPHRTSAYAGAPYAQPLPPRARRRKGGGGGIVFGLILLVGALLMLNRSVLDVTIPFLPSDSGAAAWGAWTGISLLIIGIAIVVAGLRGRTSGGLGALAIVGLIVALPTVWWAQEESNVYSRLSEGREIVDKVFDGRVDGYEPGEPITEGTAAPTRIAEAEDGYSVRWGEPTIDLTGLDLSQVDPGEPVEVPIAVGAGSATVVIPEGAAVEVESTISAGALEWLVDGDSRTYSGVNERVDIASDEVDDDGAQLRLVVDVAAGDLIIEEEK
ncbi:hypothetical protein GCM10028784_09210 [Myceligenerans cantabricum]